MRISHRVVQNVYPRLDQKNLRVCAMRKGRPSPTLSPSLKRAATNAVPARQHGACPHLSRYLLPRGGRSRRRLASRVARLSAVPRIAKVSAFPPSPRDARDRDRARGRRRGDARRGAAVAIGSSVCLAAVAASRAALARSPRGRGRPVARNAERGPPRVFLNERCSARTRRLSDVSLTSH